MIIISSVGYECVNMDLS